MAKNTNTNYFDELVPVYLFKDGDKYKDDVFVSVNDKRIQVKRGERVMIPRKFALVLERQERQDMATQQLIERKSDEYRKIRDMF